MQSRVSCAYCIMLSWRLWRLYTARSMPGIYEYREAKKNPPADRQRVYICIPVLCSRRPSISHAFSALSRTFQRVRLCLYVFSVCGVVGLLCRLKRYNIRAGITPLLRPVLPYNQQHTTRPAWVYYTRDNMRHGHAPIVARPAARQWYIFP